jgi:hypothetical protein
VKTIGIVGRPRLAQLGLLGSRYTMTGPVIDTTIVHAQAAVEMALADEPGTGS